MDHRDVWFVGLLALAYLVVDASMPSRSRVPSRDAAAPGRAEAETRSLRQAVRDACPRDLRHSISLRRDGAMWCLSCDEAFYPAGLVI